MGMWARTLGPDPGSLTASCLVEAGGVTGGGTGLSWLCRCRGRGRLAGLIIKYLLFYFGNSIGSFQR